MCRDEAEKAKPDSQGMKIDFVRFTPMCGLEAANMLGMAPKDWQ